MILIGQYDSPFVRRVGIALRLYGMGFEHRPWSAFSDAQKLRALNPLTRVPTLVLEDGDVLTESHMILDYLDSRVPEEKALFPRAEPARHRALALAALSTGLGEKGTSLFYERRYHEVASEAWTARCRAQLGATLELLEAKRVAAPGPYFGDRIGHADIALACVLRFLADALPGIVDWARLSALEAHSKRHEAMPVFTEISQAFVPPT
jgi:glutathione S-transferase